MSNKPNNISQRLLPLFVGFCLLLVIPVLWNLIKVQWVDGAKWRQTDKESTVLWREVKAQRGTIYSADGKMLATSLPVYDIILDLGKEKVGKYDKYDDSVKVSKDSLIHYKWIIPENSFKKFLPALCDSLAHIFPDKSFEYYYNYLSTERKRGNRYCTLKKGVSFYDMKRMKTFPLLMADTTGKGAKVKNLEPRFCRAVICNNRPIRVHPFGDMARHTIGFQRNVGDSVSYNGLEGFYDEYLRGQQGHQWQQKIGRSKGETMWKPIENSNQKRAVDGMDVVSTIDTRLQELAYNSLYKCMSENQADHGCVILMEVSTGYVRAISSLKYIDSVRGYEENNNIACVFSYEPGSTFKTVTDMVLLEKGKCDTSDIVPTGERTYYEDSTTKNTKPKKVKITDSHFKGVVSNTTMKHSFEISSNVGTCYPVWQNYRNNRKEFRNQLVSILPMDRLGLDLALQEPKPYMVEDLSQPIDFLNLCYGYVTRFTALQMLTFYNAIANRGKMVKPLFCSEIRQGSETVKVMKPIVLKEKICSDKTLDIINDMLIGVVENGSAHRRLARTPYGIAGKTGTTQLNYTQKGTESMRYCASFAGYFPTDNPQYSCIVVISNPKQGRTYGGELAAPVFKDLADRVCGTILNMEMRIPKEKNVAMPFIKKGTASDIINDYKYLGIKYWSSDTSTTATWLDAEQDSNGNAIYHSYQLPAGKVPNCKGMTAKDAVYMLEKMGLKVSLEGRGKVRSQSIQANQAYRQGDKIHLVLYPEQLPLPMIEQKTEKKEQPKKS